MAGMNGENTKSVNRMFKTIVCVLILSSLVLFIIWGWHHSLSADEAAHQAYINFNAVVQKETAIEVNGAKEIDENCIVKFSFNETNKTFSFYVNKNIPPPGSYEEKKNVLNELIKEKRGNREKIVHLSEMCEQAKREGLNLKENTFKWKKDIKIAEIKYDKGFSDSFFCFIRRSDVVKMKSVCNSIFSMLQAMTEDKNKTCAFVIAEDKELQIVNCVLQEKKNDKNEEVYKIKNVAFKVDREKDAAKMFNILQYVIYNLEKAGSTNVVNPQPEAENKGSA